MLTILLGLTSALCYALVDLLMMSVVRRVPVATALVWLVGTGVVISVPLAVAVDGLPSGSSEWRGVWIAALGGITYMAALGALFRGLAVGQLTIVSPLNAMEGAFAALIALLLGEHIGMLAAVGLPLAVIGVVLASLEHTASVSPASDSASAVVAATTVGSGAVAELTTSGLRSGGPNRWAAARGAGWALTAAVAGGTTILLYGWAAGLPPLSAVAVSRLVSLAIVIAYALTHEGLRLPRELRPRVVLIGFLDVAAFVALAMATSRGPLSVAAVTTAQFATFAVILGAVVLHERPAGRQRVGIVATLAAVTLLALAEQ